MPNSNPTTTTEAQAPDDGAAVPALAWLSVADAAAVLGVSTRAVQKRAERGTLPARRVQHGRALRWEIDGRELDAKGSQDVRKMDAKPANSERESVRKTGARRSQDGRTGDGDLNARLLAQLESENSFLRATVEQLQRDGAETRAALRAALKLTESATVPQLTAGGRSAPRSTFTPSPDATAPTEAPAGAALTYGDIADELERQIKT